MNGDVYTEDDVVKAVSAEDGSAVEVPRRWLDADSPYRDSFTRDGVEEAVAAEEARGEELAPVTVDSHTRAQLEAEAVAEGMEEADAKAAPTKQDLVDFINSKRS